MPTETQIENLGENVKGRIREGLVLYPGKCPNRHSAIGTATILHNELVAALTVDPAKTAGAHGRSMRALENMAAFCLRTQCELPSGPGNPGASKE